MSTIDYGIVLNISDISSASDASIGLALGVFYWVTGRPGYSGSGYSGEAPAGKTWKQGMITSKEQIAPITRIMPDIDKTGGYGSLSGFSFKVDNTSALWNTLEANSYHIINRPIDVYIFISDVSYQVWGGVVASVEYDETTYTISCEDDFKLIHKPLPPKELTEASFPDIADKSIGKTVPICFGYVKYAKFVNVLTNITPINLSNYNGLIGTVGSLRDYSVSGKYIDLYTPGMAFRAYDLADKYLVGIVGTTDRIKINYNGATDTSGGEQKYWTRIHLAGWFGTDPATINKVGTNPATNGTITVWYFEISDFQATHIVSDGDIDSYYQEDNGSRMGLRYWDNDLEDYVDMSEILNYSSATNINNTGFPGVQIMAKSADLEGNITKLFTLRPLEIKQRDIGAGYWVTTADIISGNTFLSDADHPLLRDGNSATGYQITATGSGSEFELYSDFQCKMPDLSRYDFEKVFIAFHFIFTSSGDSYVHDQNFYAVDIQARQTSLILSNPNTVTYPAGSTPVGGICEIPLIHYNTTGTDTVYYAIVSSVDLISFLNDSDKTKAYPFIVARFKWTFKTMISMVTTLNIYEIAIAGQKEINVIKEDIYTKLLGESVA